MLTRRIELRERAHQVRQLRVGACAQEEASPSSVAPAFLKHAGTYGRSVEDGSSRTPTIRIRPTHPIVPTEPRPVGFDLRKEQDSALVKQPLVEPPQEQATT
jgi:hypothetical protein